MKPTKGKIEKRGANRKPAVPPSPLRQGLDAVQERVRRVAEKLGYDTRRPDWLELAFEEAQKHPCDYDDDLFTRLPEPMQARSDALRIVAYLAHDCFPRIEEEVRDVERFLAELLPLLEAEMAPMPCDMYVKQLEKRIEKKAA
jgi:hypothetical protein